MMNSKYEIDYDNRNQNIMRGSYDTTIIMVNSQVNSVWAGIGAQTIDPVSLLPNGKSNASFTSILNYPLILDNNFEYVCCVNKVSFDISQYSSSITTSFNINFDQIQFQYYDGLQQQVLHKTIPIKNTGTLITGFYSPFNDEPKNLIFRFLNPSNKVISRITFNITDSLGVPLISTDPLVPTLIQLVIKKVSAEQQY